jgi:hypothetical protein
MTAVHHPVAPAVDGSWMDCERSVIHTLHVHRPLKTDRRSLIHERTFLLTTMSACDAIHSIHRHY